MLLLIFEVFVTRPSCKTDGVALIVMHTDNMRGKSPVCVRSPYDCSDESTPQGSTNFTFTCDPPKLGRLYMRKNQNEAPGCVCRFGL